MASRSDARGTISRELPAAFVAALLAGAPGRLANRDRQWALEPIPSAVLYVPGGSVGATGETGMLNGKQDQTWSGSEQARRETPWDWHDDVVEGGRVRDRVLRWWHARSSGLDHPATQDSDLEQVLQCAECGERFRAPPGTIRCMSCCDEE